VFKIQHVTGFTFKVLTINRLSGFSEKQAANHFFIQIFFTNFVLVRNLSAIIALWIFGQSSHLDFMLKQFLNLGRLMQCCDEKTGF